MKKKIIFLGLALSALVLAGLVGVKTIQAEGNGNYPPLIQKLVERFNLDANEVQEVFDEVREERHQEMQARMEERLNQAVEEGKITEEQKEAILAKKAEMQARGEELKDLSPEERKEAMEEHREEMKAWLEENGLDLGEFFGGFKGFHGPHFGPKFGSQ